MQPMTADEFRRRYVEHDQGLSRSEAKRIDLALKEWEALLKASELLLNTTPKEIRLEHNTGFVYALGWARGLFRKSESRRRPDQPSGGKPVATDEP